MTVVASTEGTPTSFGASAGYRAAPTDCQDDLDPLLCVPHKYFREHVVPDLPTYTVPREPAQDGYYNHPLGITFFVAEERQSGSPLFTGVFDSRTAAPLAGFLHDDSASELYFHPGTWTEAAQAPLYAGDGAWARIVEEPFLGCIDPSPLMAQVMQMFIIEDLADCGIIFAMPFPLIPPDATQEEHQWCPPEVEAHAVTLLATTEDHPWFSTECPAPEDAFHNCYTQ